MQKELKNDVVIIDENSIKDKIYEIRGQKVMLDFELAEIYGYETKRFNTQIKNNIARFPSEFYFQLTIDEYKDLARSKKSTAQIWTVGNKGGRTYIPYVLTEQGIYMLMTVLKGELAIKQSIALIKLFKSMKDYVFENKCLLTNTNAYIESRFFEYDKRFENIENKLEVVMTNFIDRSTFKHFLILNGERVESDIAYKKIYSLVDHSLLIIDDYIDGKTLSLLKSSKSNINVTIISDNKAKDKVDDVLLNDFTLDTKINITLKPNNDMFHDRYIFIDLGYKSEKIYHCGHSSKDSGNKITTISEINDLKLYKDRLGTLINE